MFSMGEPSSCRSVNSKQFLRASICFIWVLAACRVFSLVVVCRAVRSLMGVLLMFKNVSWVRFFRGDRLATGVFCKPNCLRLCNCSSGLRSAILVWLMYRVSKLRNVLMPFRLVNSFSPTSRVIRLVRACRGSRVVMPALRRCSAVSYTHLDVYKRQK